MSYGARIQMEPMSLYLQTVNYVNYCATGLKKRPDNTGNAKELSWALVI